MRRVTVSFVLHHSLGCQQMCQLPPGAAASGACAVCGDHGRRAVLGALPSPGTLLAWEREMSRYTRGRRISFPDGTTHRLLLLYTCTVS